MKAALLLAVLAAVPAIAEDPAPGGRDQGALRPEQELPEVRGAPVRPAYRQDSPDPPAFPPAPRGARPPAAATAAEGIPAGLSPQSEELLREMMEKMRRGEPVDPVYYFARMLELDPQRFREAILAISQLAAADGATASRPGLKSELWAEFIRRNRNDPAGFAGLAQSRAEQGDYRGTVAAYSRAIKLGGESPDAFYGRGFAAEQLGDHELAHADARRAMELDPDNQAALSLYKLTAGLPSMNRIDAASGEPQPGFDSGRGEPPAREPGLGGTEVRLEGSGASEDPRSSSAPDSLRRSAELTREAQRLLQAGDADGAMEAAGRAVSLDPGNAQAYNILAMALERGGQHARAVLNADRALALAPDSGPALNTRAWALNGLRRFEDALQDSMKVLQMNPNDGYGHLNKARAEGGLGRREEMLASLRRAAELDPRLSRFYDSAIRMPQSSDTELLFAGMLEHPAPPAPPGRRLHALWLSALVGGLLVAFGLSQALAARRPEPPAVQRGPTPEPPSRGGGELEQYELVRIIGTGGAGVVYEGLDRGLKRRVAIKKLRGEIRDDPRERDRFLREARTAGELRHPNIVQIYSILERGADIYLVFEFVEGRTLKEISALRKSLPLREAVDVFSGACEGLDYAHGRGVIHGGLKPSNIIVDDELVSKVMDFGVARQRKDALVKAAAAGAAWGSPQYTAPEAEEGLARKESDIYSLGVCLYEALTGRLPFRGACEAMYADKAAGRFEPPSRSVSLPKSVDALIARALAPEPEDRFPTPRDFLLALEEVGAGR